MCVRVEEKPKKTKKTSLSGRITLTFTDPVQPLPLHFVFVSQGHGVTHKHGSARQGTSSSSAADTDKVQTPSALSALFPGAYRLGTHTCEEGREKKNIQLEHDTYGAQTHTLVLHVHTLLMY